MEHRNIKIAQLTTKDTHNRKPALMDVCTRKNDREKIWKWMHETKIYWLADVLDQEGNIRMGMLESVDPTVKSSIIHQVTKFTRKHPRELIGNNNRLFPGCIVRKEGTTELGMIKQVKETELTVEVLPTQQERKRRKVRQIWRTRRCIETGYKQWWNQRPNMTREIGINNNTKNKTSANEQQKEQIHTAQWDGETHKKSRGLLKIDPTTIHNLKQDASQLNICITIVSDGSVRDSSYRGTWAWSLVMVERNNPTLAGVTAVGKETLGEQSLVTAEQHSYRMEAMTLLDGLTYMKNEIDWKGTIEWYTDSESIIKSWAKVRRGMAVGDWTKQIDKDVWETLLKLSTWWGDRVTLNHVESHVDRKKDKNGQYRIPTEMERMNIAIDAVADEGYTDTRVPDTVVHTRERYQRYVPYMKAPDGSWAEVTGSFRPQILEEIRIQDTKKRASLAQSTLTWGRYDNNIDWRRMRRTQPTKTMHGRLWTSKWIHGKLATNTHLYDMHIHDTPLCSLCGKQPETTLHLMCECMDDGAKKSRASLMGNMWALIDQHGHAEAPIIKYDWKRELKKVYADLKDGQRHSKLEPKYLTQTDWQTSWNKAQEGHRRTFTEELQGRVMETFVRFNATHPTWTGVITKTWIWCLKKIGIKESNMNSYIKGHRRQLHAHITRMWKLRAKKIEARPIGEVRQERARMKPIITPCNTNTSTHPSILDMLPLQNIIRSTNNTTRQRDTRTHTQLIIQQDGNKQKCGRSVTQPTERWGSSKEAPTTAKEDKDRPEHGSNILLVEMFAAQRKRQKNNGKKRKITPTNLSKINKRTKPQTTTQNRTTKRKRTTPNQQHKTNSQDTEVTTKKKKATGRRRGVVPEGRIYKGVKKPREHYIRVMQYWMDGKRTTEVVGVKDYTKPRTGKTAKFNNTDLKYYIKCGYCTVKNSSEEQYKHPATPPPPKTKPTSPPRNNTETPQHNEHPEPQELTEANLNIHNSMRTPQQQTRSHNNDSEYSPAELASAISSYTMATSSAYVSSEDETDMTNNSNAVKPRPRETQGPLTEKEQGELNRMRGR